MTQDLNVKLARVIFLFIIAHSCHHFIKTSLSARDQYFVKKKN